MQQFKRYLLSRHSVTEKQLPYYVNWVSQFYNFNPKARNDAISPDEIDKYLDLLNRRKEGWQVEQAREAIQIYQLCISRSNHEQRTAHNSGEAWKQAADEIVRMSMIDTMR